MPNPAIIISSRNHIAFLKMNIFTNAKSGKDFDKSPNLIPLIYGFHYLNLRFPRMSVFFTMTIDFYLKSAQSFQIRVMRLSERNRCLP